MNFIQCVFFTHPCGPAILYAKFYGMSKGECNPMKRVVTFNPHYQRQMLGCMLQNEAASSCTLKKHRFIDRQIKRYKHVDNQGQAMHRIRTRQERSLGVETSSQPALEPRLANCQIRNILEACHQKTSWVPAPSLLGTSDRVPLILCHFHIQ